MAPNRSSPTAPQASKAPDHVRNVLTNREPKEPRAKGGRIRQTAINLVLGGLARGIGTALPYVAVALYTAINGNEIQKTDAIAKAFGFGFVGAIFGWFAVVALGRQAATLIIPPVLFALSLYFLIQYG